MILDIATLLGNLIIKELLYDTRYRHFVGKFNY